MRLSTAVYLPEFKVVPNLLTVEKELKVKEELLSIHALNPHIPTNAGARSYMFGTHFSQIVIPIAGDTKIIQTGLEQQLAKNTFSKKFNNRSRIINIIRKYDRVVDDPSDVNEITIIYEDLEEGTIDCLVIPYYFSLHQYFGFKYVRNEKLLNSMYRGMIVEAGTIVADSPSVVDSDYRFGLTTNVVYLPLPHVAEDGFIISKSYSYRGRYNTYEKLIIDCSKDSFLLNTNGDINNYIALPKVGHQIRTDGMVCAIRQIDTTNTPSLTSRTAVLDINPLFDKCYYAKSPQSKVIDVKIYSPNNSKRFAINGTMDKARKYIEGLDKYESDLYETYTSLKNDNYRRNKVYDLNISERFSRALVNARVLTEKNKNVILTHKRQKVDLYRIEITLEVTNKLKIGSKITTMHGSKGIVVGVLDDESLPGGADVIIDPTSVPSRMNLGNPYEQYFGAISRRGKELLEIELTKHGKTINTLTNSDIEELFKIPLGLAKLIGTEMYDGYLKLNTDAKYIVIKDILENELHLYYKVSSELQEWQIVERVRGTIYEPELKQLEWTERGKHFKLKQPALLAPQYMFILAKTADNFLSCASPKTNHYGFPIGISSKQRPHLPYSNSPVRILSETEVRLYASYAGRRALIELKDRANSIPTASYIYKELLKAKIPTNIKKLVDRKKVPYGNDSAIEFISNIINPGGTKLTYVKNKRKA